MPRLRRLRGGLSVLGAPGSPRANRDLPVVPAVDGPRLLVVACTRSNLGGPGSPPLPDGAAVLELPCTGGASPALLLGALARGFDGALVLGRHQQTCRLGGAEDHAREVVERMERIARLVGLGADRVRFVEPAPGPAGPAGAIHEAVAATTASPLAEPLPAEQLTDDLDGAHQALKWLSSRPELAPDGDDWLADAGLPATAPAKPVLLAGVVPYFDLLLDEWLAADSLADQLVDGLAVLRALGRDAGVAVERYKTDYAGLAARYPDSEIFTLCPGCAASACESGASARSLVQMLAERGRELTNGASPMRVALSESEGLGAAAAALKLETVELEPAPSLGRRAMITPDEHLQLARRIARADELEASSLLVACPAALAQHLIARREGSWRRGHARPTLISALAAARRSGEEGLP
jgi:coenzyme F420-reducing hydrogenase delta subunit